MRRHLRARGEVEVPAVVHARVRVVHGEALVVLGGAVGEGRAGEHLAAVVNATGAVRGARQTLVVKSKKVTPERFISAIHAVGSYLSEQGC